MKRCRRTRSGPVPGSEEQGFKGRPYGGAGSLYLDEMKHPVARRIPHPTSVHGELGEDDYAWMREKENPEVLEHLAAENAYADAMMKPTESLQEALYKEILGRIKETDLSVPYRRRGFYYYSRTEEGKQYPIHCRKVGSLDAPEEVLLEMNAMAKDLKFLALGAFDVSEDGHRLAYSTDVTGFRQYTLHVKDLRTGEVLPDRVERVSGITWALDNETLFYVTEDEAKRPYRLYRHRLGTSEHVLLYEEKDERFFLDVWRTRSGRFLVAHSESKTATEMRLLPSGEPEGEWRLVRAREAEHEYHVDHHGEHLYIRTNDQGRNFRLVRCPVGDLGPQNWEEVVPHRPEVMLEGTDLFANHLVLREREGGLPQLTIRDLRTGVSHRIAFPEPAYGAGPEQNHEFETTVLRYAYTSLITPPPVLDYDVDSRTSTLLKQREALGGYDPAQY